MPDASAYPSSVTGDRRARRRLRDIFDEALGRVEPLLDPVGTWPGAEFECSAHRVMREHYPDLSNEEIYVFVVAAKCVFSARHAAREPRD